MIFGRTMLSSLYSPSSIYFRMAVYVYIHLFVYTYAYMYVYVIWFCIYSYVGCCQFMWDPIDVVEVAWKAGQPLYS